MRLNIGCGNKPKEGFINIDIAGRKADVIADCTELPFKDRTIDVIESYHLIEHLTKDKAEQSLIHWHALLKKDGKLVIECPDMVEVFLNYLGAREEDEEEFLYSVYGRHRYKYDIHYWGYSKKSLTRLLHNIGFYNIVTSAGTDYHATMEPCLRVEAKKC
jgi:predicted SAM-dependent methyltransferase